MILQEYLAALPMGDLKSMAVTLGVQPGMISRARLVREITDRVFRPEYIDQCVDELDEEAREILLAILSAGEAGRVYDTRKPSNDGVIEQLYGLLNRGLVIGRRPAYRTVDFTVPEDLRDMLIRNFTDRLAGFFSTEAGKSDDDESRDLTAVRNVFALVNGLRHNPARLTDRGLPYKRALDAMMDRQEAATNGLTDSAEEITGQTRFVMEYAQWRGLTRIEDGRLRADCEFESWLELPTTEKLANLLSFWHARDRARSPAVSALPGILQLCVGFAQVDLDQILRCVLACSSPHVRSDAFSDEERAEILAALRELEWIGLLRQFDGKNGSGGGLVITPAGRHVFGGQDWADKEAWSTRFVVQPTFEIIAPRDLDLNIREKLERFADLEKVDLTLTYRVTRDTIYRAANTDMSGAEVNGFLADHSDKDVPQNVAYSIQSWGDAYGQVYFMETFLLRTASAEISSHIKAHGELAPYIKGEVAPDALIVERKTYRELMDLLQKQGYMPRSGIVATTGAASVPSAGQAVQGARSGNGNGLRTAPKDPRERGDHADRSAHTDRNDPPDRGVHSDRIDSPTDDAQRTPSPSERKPVLGFEDCLPGYQLHRGSGGADRNAPHIEQAANLQYLSPGQTEELLEMAVQHNHRAVIEYYLGNRSRSFLHRIKPIRIERTRGTPFVEAHRIPEGDVQAFKIASIRAIRIVYEHKGQAGRS